jgi:hypothetical protein
VVFSPGSGAELIGQRQCLRDILTMEITLYVEVLGYLFDVSNQGGGEMIVGPMIARGDSSDGSARD